MSGHHVALLYNKIEFAIGGDEGAPFFESGLFKRGEKSQLSKTLEVMTSLKLPTRLSNYVLRVNKIHRMRQQRP